MDLETENQIASILMKEAAELRRQAEKEGVNAYLRDRSVSDRSVRFRPNSRFLTATVLGVQQANQVAEVNEMWKARSKELELNDKLKGSFRDKRSHSDSPRSTSSGHIEHNDSLRISSGHREHNMNIAASSKTEVDGSYSSEDGGLKDDEVQQFLHSRVKRGRGGVGPRMDEPGPYLPHMSLDSKTRLSESPDVREKEEWERRVLGPEKPLSLRSNRSFEDEANDDNWKKAKKVKLESSKKHSKKHTRKEDRHANKERKERRSKQKHKSRS